jgi:hypothetical protein
MTTQIRAESNHVRFIFSGHSAELQRRAGEWFADRLSSLTDTDQRRLVAERLFVLNSEPDVSRACLVEFKFSFQRTLRVPDDGRDYPLPAGLGCLPVRSIRHLMSPSIPPAWREGHTGIVPMHPAEATWLNFDKRLPFAVQVAAGGICAVTGAAMGSQLARTPQNYLAVPPQRWLDGFRVGPDAVRQFVAMPLGHSYTVEGQVTGEESRGGLQVRVVPLRVDLLWAKHVLPSCESAWKSLVRPRTNWDCVVKESTAGEVQYCRADQSYGLGAGGRIKQKIYEDRGPADAWDEAAASTCEIHFVPAAQWTALTGERVPTKPPTPADYARAGIPWFDDQNAAAPLTNPAPLAAVSSVNTVFKQKSGLDLPDNDPFAIATGQVVTLGASPSVATATHE